MSWKVVNEILGLAAVDQQFCEKLLRDPLVAISEKGFNLTLKEQEALRTIDAHDIYEFSRIVMARLAPQ